MDIFCEYIVKHKNTAVDLLIPTGGYIAATILTFIIMLFSQYLFGLGFLLIAAVWYGAFILMRSRYVEYEYILTNNEMDIDKIMAKKRRKRVITVNFKHIEICAKVDDPVYSSQYANKPEKIYDFTGNSEYDVYFVDFHGQDKRTRILFHPTDKMKENLRLINPGAVHLS